MKSNFKLKGFMGSNEFAIMTYDLKIGDNSFLPVITAAKRIACVSLVVALLGGWSIGKVYAQDDAAKPDHTKQIRVVVAPPDKSPGDVIAIPPFTSWTVSMERSAENPKEPLNSGDVAEWLHKVSNLNGLQTTDIQPWHIVITYDQFDEDGDNVHSGVVDELWANPKKYKISYKSDNLNQTDYATEQGLFRLGDQRWPNPAEMQVRAEIIDPFSFASKLRGLTSSSEENTFGTHTLHCVAFKKTGGISVSNQYCFEQGASVLRYVRGQGWDQTAYNDIILFNGRNVAQQVDVTNGGKPFLKLTVKTLEPITQLDEKDFTPPDNAVSLIGKRVTGVPRQPVKISFPEWPESLRQQHFIIGLQIVIGKDGHVVSAQAVSGPSDAYKAAENAVRKWVFEPYLVLGEPSEVETKVQLSNQ
ncbi:energy transducer TonB [Tunturiibacter lichenicola]|jgi:hypothetical protein|uniref:energy transducer TonB n=1 Tax=Tunturiibacter lichenicola TaxID=2051959 RepID=UPI0021B1C80F|nr:energy transducer TonB [Edaphobacter lichenicola]